MRRRTSSKKFRPKNFWANFKEVADRQLSFFVGALTADRHVYAGARHLKLTGDSRDVFTCLQHDYFSVDYVVSLC